MKIFNTKCEKCIFKITENDKQTGCIFDIKDILTKNYRGLYDDNNFIVNNNYWTIKNFRCPYARTQEWLEVLNRDSEYDAVQKVIEDAVIPCYCVILMDSVDDDVNEIIDDMSLNNIYHPIYLSFILTKKSRYTPKNLAEILNQNNLPKWKIHFIIDEQSTISEMIDMALDTNLNNTSASIIIIKYADTIYKTNFIQRVNEIISHCYGKQIAIMTDNFLDGFITDKTLYNSLGNKIGVVYDFIVNNDEVNKIKIL